MTRLPPTEGQWIDRNSPLEFCFEGRTYRGYRGDVATSALWAAGVRMIGRSFKYHRPRGAYSLANHDINAMFENGRTTNLRGDVLQLEAGLDLRAVNTLGGVAGDWLRLTQWAARVMPVGFYYKAFHTPRKLFPFYEKQLRKVAGLGAIQADHRSEPTPKDYASCDLLVIGSGASGLAGAIAAAEKGLQVVIVDEQPHAGGSLCWQALTDPHISSKRNELLAVVHANPNIELRTTTQVAGSYADLWFALVDSTRLTKLRARSVLVASGAIEQPAVFHNNDLPGILLGSAAQRLIHLYAVMPFTRCVVLAANSDAYRTALDLHAAGVEVAAIADLRPDAERTQLSNEVAQAGIEIRPQHTVYEALSNRQKTNVAGVTLCPLDQNGQPDVLASERIACDGVVVSVGWAPAAAPLYQLGAKLQYASHVEQFVPQSLPEGVFAAGRVNGLFSLEDRLADGRRAGLKAVEHLGHATEPAPESPRHEGSPPSHPYPIFAHPKQKNFVDFDEDIHLVDFANAHQEGYDNIELVKRYTTVGMGPSQGKLSNMNAVRILARLNGQSIDETGSTTSRPFYHPVSLGHLAGRRFHPLRRTPMHGWHVTAGAKFVHAGAWLRPEYYEVKGKTRAQTILAEAQHVRDCLGLIDLGTLGKIQVTGPGSAEFLERIYTGRFRRQKVGQLRYAMACDETGVIIDDGIVARLDDDRFYVSATTGGAARFFSDMQRWALIWKSDVTLVNLTGQLTALNLTGPLSREVLSELTDVDLSADAFPFGGVREGTVVGVPAILIRVGFVGEIGYEIHVPASQGLAVWNALREAGAAAEIRPFGIEAQRLLRLEKGHLIVSIDTDALTNPFEVGAEWALGMDKPFFVGQRSLRIVEKQALTRRLVGISFEEDHAGPLPEECHLVVAGGELAGRVTSIAHDSTVGRAIGLAFVRPDLAEPGAKIQIRVDGGQLVEAVVTALPFYDPENLRQR
ncbi:glycine cleavage T C-terminal barrel domain-containing protein [Pirellulales bacterium]|nr:glycine cleavage T C-terminal barrel domain-containing protein [Pirellulales bacterium]